VERDGFEPEKSLAVLPRTQSETPPLRRFERHAFRLFGDREERHDLVKEAGVAKATFYGYFENLTALQAAVADETSVAAPSAEIG
jgi:hypothetical protein